MRTDNQVNNDSVQVQELILLLLHQAKSPLVAADGFIDMVGQEGANNQLIAKKLLRYARASSWRTMAIIELATRLLELQMPESHICCEPIQLTGVLDEAFSNNAATRGKKWPKLKLQRTYKLPLVVADRSLLAESFYLIAQLANRTTKGSQPLIVSFRPRDDFEVIKFSSPLLADELTAIKQVYLKGANPARLAADYKSELVATGYILRRNIELMGGFVRVEAKRGMPLSLYIHLPICRQLHLDRLLIGDGDKVVHNLDI